ncbi:MAG: prsT [Massilia sp.]|nr:prsT [Massilia sp.]
MIRPIRPSRSRYRRVALALSLGVALGGCQRASDPGALIAEARHYRQQGDIDAAVIQLKNALQKDPNNRDARRLLGEVYIEQADAVSAEKELRRALALGSPTADLLVMLGKSLLLQGEYQRVLDEFTSVPDPAARPAVLALRGSALLGLGKRPDAGVLFEQALKAAPALPEALLGLARIAFADGSPARSAELVERALAAHPADAECMRFKGDLLRIDGRIDAALAAYRAILELHPHNAQARVDVASVLTDQGKFAEARAELRAARKVSPGRLSLFYAQAMLDYREAKYPAATESLQQILRAAPEYYPAILLLGAVESATGANQLAEQHVQKFLAAYPGHLHATKLMGTLYMRANNSGAVLELVAPLLAKHADDVDLLMLAGEAHMRARHFSQAAEYFERASALRPRLSTLHTAAALGRLGNGEHERAMAELERAAVLDIKSPRNGTLLVMGYLRANAPDKALAAVRDMEKQGDGALVQNLKGGVFLARQDLAGARASFARALAHDPLYLPALDNLAQLDLLEKRPDDAKKRYQAALAKSPKSAPLMEALARLATGQGRPQEAIGWLERACRENPESTTLALRLADYYVRGGDTRKALTLVQKLQGGNPSNPDVLSMLAQVHAARHDLPAAADAYARLALLQPASSRPQMKLASLQLALHDERAAIAALRRAIAIEPGLMDAHQMLLAILLGQKKFAEASQLAAALQQRMPQSAGGYKLEGDLRIAQGQPAAALAAYELAFALEPASALMIQVHGALVAAGKPGEADKRMAQWLARHPDDVPARLHDASSKLVRNDVRAAIEQLEAVLRRDPNHVLALNDLAWALQRIQDKRALSFAERAYRLAPGSPAIMDTLGCICLESGDIARALPLLQKASALAPNAGEIRYHLGQVLAKSGDRRGARRELERLLSSTTDGARRADAKALLATL